MIGDSVLGALFHDPSDGRPVLEPETAPAADDGCDDEYDERHPCWQCGGDGHLGAACFDDLCHGGHDVPCFHGDPWTIPCDICDGEGLL